MCGKKYNIDAVSMPRYDSLTIVIPTKIKNDFELTDKSKQLTREVSVRSDPDDEDECLELKSAVS